MRQAHNLKVRGSNPLPPQPKFPALHEIKKKYMGIVRTTFLINTKGKIHRIWSKVRVKDHAKKVLEELKNI